MVRNLKTLSFIALVLLLTFVTACSGNNSGSNQDGSAAPTTSPDSTSSAPGGDSKTTELNVWGNPSMDWQTNTDPKNLAIYDYIQSEMEKKFPGIKINYINKGWGDDLRQNIMLAVMGGTTPDVGNGEDFVAEFAKIGSLVEVPAELTAGLAEGPLLGGVYEGKNYAVSGLTGVFALMYNKDVMVKAGLDPNTPPKTWDEWLEMSKKVTEAGKGEYYGSVVQNMGLGGTFRIAPFMRQAGGDLSTADWKQTTFQSPENIKALTFIRELSKTAPKGSTSMTDEGALYNMVLQGQAAFAVGGSWHISAAKSENCNCGFAPLPTPDTGGMGNVIVGNVLWYALKASKNQEASLEYLRIMASAEYQEMMAIATGRLPSNTEVSSSAKLIETYPEIKPFLDAVANESPKPLPVYEKEGPAVREIWYNAQSDVLTTDKPISEIVEKAQKEAEALLQ